MRSFPLLRSLVLACLLVIPGALAMNKAELIDAIAADAGLSKADAGRALEAMTVVLTHAVLRKGDEVKLVGFGTFTKPNRQALDDDSDGDGLCDGMDNDCDTICGNGIDDDCDSPVDFIIEGETLRKSVSIYPHFVSQYYSDIAMYMGQVDANPLYNGNTMQGENPMYDANRFMDTSSCLMQAFARVMAGSNPTKMLDRASRDEYAQGAQKELQELALKCSDNEHVQANLKAAWNALMEQALRYDADTTKPPEPDRMPPETMPPEEKPTDEKPTDEKPNDEKPVDEKPTDEKPTDEKPTDEKPTDVKPVDTKPIDVKPIDQKEEIKPAESTRPMEYAEQTHAVRTKELMADERGNTRHLRPVQASMSGRHPHVGDLPAAKSDRKRPGRVKYGDISLREMVSKAVHHGRLEVGTDLSPEVAQRILDAMARCIIRALEAGDEVHAGFGSFSVSKRAARTGRNPQTGKEIKIAAKNVVKFKAGKALSDKVK